ncbi:MAG TPA: alpha-2-macroglobulin family protein [Blastocatellia bacterium]
MMSDLWRAGLLCVLIGSAGQLLAGPHPVLFIDPKAARVSLADSPPVVFLPMRNDSAGDITGVLSVQLVGPDDRVIASNDQEIIIKPGASTATVPIKGFEDTIGPQLLWDRVRYSITDKNSKAADSVIASGIVSLSEITPDFFDIAIETPRLAAAISPYHLRVRAFHPFSFVPASGVALEVEMKFDDPASQATPLTATTDENGYATFEVPIPLNITHINSWDATVTVRARRGGLTRILESDIELGVFPDILITTDKPMYQPGQTLHARVLLRDDRDHAARANEPVTLTIDDPDNLGVFRADLVTSRFGIAAADWNIPPDQRIGDFILSVELGSGGDTPYRRSQIVKISRYELPTFTVTVKPDRAYYLAGQDAALEVKADYLFGQPVTHGSVRVVREDDRQWDYARQRWDITEGDDYQGDFDAGGRFVARIKLADAYKKFQENGYSRFVDLNYCAYVTDLTTGKIQQRRFDIRLTRYPIHIYTLSDRQAAGPDGRIKLYLSASYADGVPAHCRIRVSQTSSEDTGKERPINGSGAELTTVATNQYGIAKVELNESAMSGDAERIGLLLKATDGKGLTGYHIETVYPRQAFPVRVETSKTIYRPGEPIVAMIQSKSPVAMVVDASIDGVILQSMVVRTGINPTRVAIPYRESFKSGPVTISAYEARKGPDESLDCKTVIYPSGTKLKVGIDMARSTYRPGENAEAKVRVQNVDGTGAAGVLGATVYDKAVDERATSDDAGYGYLQASYEAGWGKPYYDRGDIAGISLTDIQSLDTTEPVPAGLDLVAEVLTRSFSSTIEEDAPKDAIELDPGRIFSQSLRFQLNPVEYALTKIFTSRHEYPTDGNSFQRLLLETGIDFRDYRDPWGTPYNVGFAVEGTKQVARIISAGPNARFGDADDFTAWRLEWPYFEKAGQLIDRAVKAYHQRTGGYIRDEPTLRAELLPSGLDIKSLKDPWGHAYRYVFGVSQTNYILTVFASGSNRAPSQWPEGIDVWDNQIDYFEEQRTLMSSALNAYFSQTGRFPTTEAELGQALAAHGIDLNNLNDPWGRPYCTVFEISSRYSDDVKIEDLAVNGGPAQKHIQITPVTQTLVHVYLRSSGQDGKRGTPDDFEAASFSQLVDNRDSNGTKLAATAKPVFSDDSGAVAGIVTDPNGAIISNATIQATDMNSTEPRLVYTAKTNSNGSFVLGGLPRGVYEIRFESAGFVPLVEQKIAVSAAVVTQLDVTMTVGSSTERVTVTAQSSTLNSTARSVSISEETKPGTTAGAKRLQVSTPRPRQYFPETLLWQPQLETGSNGTATLKFKMADSLTTWKMRVIASTLDGGFASADKEIVAYQPFFLEHDPPQVLTQGDRILLPVVVRNYTDAGQQVELSVKPGDWFTVGGESRKRVRAPAHDTASAVFDFSATSATEEGKQRVTALGSDSSDSVEKIVRVNPDGRQMVLTDGAILGGTADFSLEIPKQTIDGSIRGTVKIYPNLSSHVLETLEGIMQRPYGCAEQTISSAFPGLAVLRYYKSRGEPLPEAAERAQAYLGAAYARLLGYRSAEGGFTYWGSGGPDTALTAYALDFLTQASEFITVDSAVIDAAVVWITHNQSPDGSWASPAWSWHYDLGERVQLTAYVGRVLASLDFKRQDSESRPANRSKANRAVVQAALGYLSRQIKTVDDPYFVASYALAELGQGDVNSARPAVEKLRALVHDESATSYWVLQENTPFYGWGLAGRIETTALAVRALSKFNSRIARDNKNRSSKASSPAPAESTGGTSAAGDISERDRRLIDRGLRFLLRNEDRYGVWYSTQATISVLDTLLAELSEDQPVKDSSNSAGPDQRASVATGTDLSAQIFVNGRLADTIPIPRDSKMENPLTFNVSKYLVPGDNRVELRGVAGAEKATAQLVTSYYVPWANAASRNDSLDSAAAKSLSFSVIYGNTEPHAGEDVTCSVRIERVGFRGYGMLVAEIGLPPGAEVDRQSLDSAVQRSVFQIDRYEVLPDRVVVYAWPQAGGTHFEFKFRLRYAESAQTAPSCLYDYYNPEATIVRGPAKFTVRGAAVSPR